MSPSFFQDYCPCITTELRTYRHPMTGQVTGRQFRVQASDADGEALLGAHSPKNFGEAYWTLREFVEGECGRRGIP
mgnify:CR=1 FL=1